MKSQAQSATEPAAADARGATAGDQMILRARLVLPVVAPPIENGAVLLSGHRLVAVGAWSDISRHTVGHRIFDLGEVLLLPGLIDAHCHLDYTDMAGQVAPPGNFLDWIPQILALKAAWGFSDYAASWLHGARMLLQSGVTTVADIESVPELLPEVWSATPLRVISFLEMTGVRSKRPPGEILREALEKIEALGCLDEAGMFRKLPALSPHAPYSTSPELLRLCAAVAREKKLLLATHVAESEAEFEMFACARGEMFDWLQRNGRDNSDCGRGSPVAHLERTGLLGENCLAVHANYLEGNDFERLARHQVSVVHCPRSHDFFRHRKFPLTALLRAGVNVCLGTDSLATVRCGGEPPELSLFAEMQTLAANEPRLRPETILRLATVNGARALGLAGKIGALTEKAWSDLIAIPFRGKISTAAEAVVNFSGRVQASMIAGEWAVTPP
ncbi:MAG TPA: amidohydrolase family protein [Verrucomicrobiae bacterium]|nr:amidohydrolase family protein [Verrucomicrobiae bacterium]